MNSLLNVDKAIDNILNQVQRVESEVIPLENSLYRILAEDITSDVDLPPFDNSAMDGFAIRAVDSTNADANPVQLKVVMDIPAGVSPTRAIQPGEAAQIMTGAPMPEGADAVIPVEDTDADFSNLERGILSRTVTLHKHIESGNNVRLVGENISRGQVILSGGMLVRPAEIGILASIGKPQIPVVRRPRVVIMGSGDELVELDAPITPGKIRDSNSYALQALVQEDGGEVIRLPHAADDPAALRALFQSALNQNPDVIITSAGVSVGAADYVRDILEKMGTIDFWRINMRPGKPLAFGKIGDVPFFGLPGNPVSAMITYDVIVRPALLKLAGRADTAQYKTAVTGEVFRSDGRRTYARVRLQQEDGNLVAYQTGTQSSGAHMSMVLADGLLIIPENQRETPKGVSLQVRMLRDMSSSE